MRNDDEAPGRFEIHVGFPDEEQATFDRFMGLDPRWAPMTFGQVWRNKAVARHEAHDVPGGIRYLATATASTFGDAVEMLKVAHRAIGPNPLVRAEIERALSSPRGRLSNLLATTSPPSPEDGLVWVDDLPAWESHIGIRSADGGALPHRALGSLMASGDCRFNELALATDEKKAIFTIFWRDAETMFARTPRIAEDLRDTFSFAPVVKISMEEIVLCAKFG